MIREGGQTPPAAGRALRVRTVLTAAAAATAAATAAAGVLGGQGRQTTAAAPPVPELVIEAPDDLAADAARVRALDARSLAPVMALFGLTEPGNPIRVLLVPETSRIARETDPWVAGFADAAHDLIVVFPARVGPYPYDSLDAVLQHEVAHILAVRAAAGGRLPRWFNEGLASVAERTWGLAARSRLFGAALTAGQPTITELEGLFAGGRRDAARAYAIAHAIVRDIIRRHGAAVIPRILDGVAAGAPFDHAFAAATGTTATGAARLFWRSAGGWEEWLTFLASPFTLWTLITALSLAAIWRHRLRRAERRRQWELEEELAEGPAPLPPELLPPRDRVH